jgi:integrase
MGIYKRGDTWCVRIWYVENGKKKKLERAIGPDRKTALAVQQKLEQERALSNAAGQLWTGLKNVQAARSQYTFGEAFEDYLVKTPLKLSTQRSYRHRFNCHLKERLGDVPLTKIDRDMLVAMQSDLRVWRQDGTDKPLTNSSINAIMKVVRSVLKRAVDDDKLAESPMSRIRQLRVEEPDIDPFDLAELDAALACMDKFYVPVFTVLAYSGMRPNELIGLKWGDIDWKRNEIKISRGVVRKIESTTKTKSGKRIIPMHPEVRRVMESLRDAKVMNLRSFIFMSKRGQVMSNHLDDVWRRTLVQAGVCHRASYQLRHTWASMALAAGEDPMWVANMLGHANAAITFKHYARFIPNQKHGKAIASVSHSKLGPKSKAE